MTYMDPCFVDWIERGIRCGRGDWTVGVLRSFCVGESIVVLMRNGTKPLK